MQKRFMSVIICGLLALTTLGACGKKGDLDRPSALNQSAPTPIMTSSMT